MSYREIALTPHDTGDILPALTFCDGYDVTLTSSDISPADLYWGIFANSPDWVNSLMDLRNKIVRKFGLKTEGMAFSDLSKQGINPNDFKPGDKLGPFHILENTPDLFIAGEDDKHLDFRIVVRRTEPTTLRVITLVNTHNALGRAYMFVVKPFHKVIVRATLKRALKILTAA